MKGDFTRGHQPDRKRGMKYRRVLLQQGRLVLDSDVAASVDASDSLVRDLAADAVGIHGSPDLGYLVTPGPLFALFDSFDNVEGPTTGTFKTYRDHGVKYLERFPSLYLGALQKEGTVKITGRQTLSAQSFPKLRIWARIPNAVHVAVTVAGKNLGTITGIGTNTFEAYDLDLAGAAVTDFATMTIGFSGPGPNHEAWIGLIEGVQPAGSQPHFWIASGRYYVAGLEVELDALGIDGRYPAITFPKDTQKALTKPAPRHVVAYLEGWERLVTHVEDAGILEQALGGALDTTVRTQAVGQVKLALVEQPVNATGIDAAEVLAAFSAVDRGHAQLDVTPAQTVENSDPCAIAESGGYTGPDNRLYRFEVHTGGDLGDVLLKWSKNNGADLFDVKTIDAVTGTITTTANTSLENGDLVEVLTERDDLGDASEAKISLLQAPFFRPAERSVGTLRYVRKTNKNGEIELLDLKTKKAAAIAVPAGVEVKVRRWHGLFSTAPANGSPTPTKAFVIDGLTITLSGTSFRAGDYWQYEARKGVANTNAGGSKTFHGPERVFAPLALLNWESAAKPLVLERWFDKRVSALAELQADDIAYDGGKVGTNADTVQEVIDELASSMVLQFVGGDGQEALPGNELHSPLRVRLTRPFGPVANETVRFTALTTNTSLARTNETFNQVSSLDVVTDPQGYAECRWRLSTALEAPDAQRVTATVLGHATNELHFTARRSVAKQVAYVPHNNCGTLQGVQNVQDAIDKLCSVAGGGSCEVTLRPEMSFAEIEKRINEALEKGDTKICFASGIYAFPQPMKFEARKCRNLVLAGAGEASRIRRIKRGWRREATLLFEGFDTVVVRDLCLESDIAESPDPGTSKDNDPHEELRGTLTFLDCVDVLVEHVHARCAAGEGRGATCVTVRGTIRDNAGTMATNVKSVRIVRCHLDVGDDQTGALVVDAERVHVEDNIVTAHGTALNWQGLSSRLRKDPRFRADLRRGLIYNVHVGRKAPAPYEIDEKMLTTRILALSRRYKTVAAINHVMPAVVSPQVLHVDKLTVSFEAPQAIANSEAFMSLLGRNVAGLSSKISVASAKALLKATMDTAITEALKESGDWTALRDLLKQMLAEYRPSASQGIVVAGRYPVETRIVNNTISGVRQGIHLGFSDRNDRTRSASRLVVTGNTVEVVLRVHSPRERHGIFVGNCGSAIIEHNIVRVDRGALAALLPIDGIRVYGVLGLLLMVRENQMDDATVGVRVHALNTNGQTAPTGVLWRVGDNVAILAKHGAIVHPGGLVSQDHPNIG